MMKSRRDLNQRLQKGLIRPLSRQPDALPMLVSQEEFLVPVASQTIRKRSATPVKSHHFLIIVEPKDRRPATSHRSVSRQSQPPKATTLITLCMRAFHLPLPTPALSVIVKESQRFRKTCESQPNS
jgi:hypothetical protein